MKIIERQAYGSLDKSVRVVARPCGRYRAGKMRSRTITIGDATPELVVALIRKVIQKKKD